MHFFFITVINSLGYNKPHIGVSCNTVGDIIKFIIVQICIVLSIYLCASLLSSWDTCSVIGIQKVSIG